jgi:hypothetical protein
MYQHLPRFMRTFGRETIGGLPLTTLNAAAMLLGLSVGRQLGAALGLPGWLFVLQTLGWIGLGVILTAEYRGLFVVRRAMLRAAYLRRVLTRRRTLDASAWIILPLADDAADPSLPGAVLGRVVQGALPRPRGEPAA